MDGVDLPGFTSLRVEVGESRVLHGEQRHLVGTPVVGMSGQLAEGVVGDDDVRTYVVDLLDDGADRGVEGNVQEPG